MYDRSSDSKQVPPLKECQTEAIREVERKTRRCSELWSSEASCSGLLLYSFLVSSFSLSFMSRSTVVMAERGSMRKLQRSSSDAFYRLASVEKMAERLVVEDLPPNPSRDSTCLE